jgi:hypothetical protein
VKCVLLDLFVCLLSSLLSCDFDLCVFVSDGLEELQ